MLFPPVLPALKFSENSPVSFRIVSRILKVTGELAFVAHVFAVMRVNPRRKLNEGLCTKPSELRSIWK